MEQPLTELSLLEDIVDRISVGVFVVNKSNELVLWNGYMENYSQTKSEDVVGKNIFECFPDLPQQWLEQKIHNVFVIRNFSFTSWEYRPYLFKFLHNRPITGGIDYMRQNCTFLPMKGASGKIDHVCITLFDVTDTSIYESMLKNAVRSLAEASNRDGLTSIYNRRFLETSMSKEFSRIKRYGGTLTFIIIDLDHFKAVNDDHGHLAGDEILKVAALRLAEGLRTADTLSRYGGEEFAVILPETPVDGGAVLAQRLCDNLAATPVVFEGKEIIVRASLGVAEFSPEMESYEAMIARADEMLYRSKENGRNQVTVYYPEKEKQAQTIEGESVTTAEAPAEGNKVVHNVESEINTQIDTAVENEVEAEVEAEAESATELESETVPAVVETNAEPAVEANVEPQAETVAKVLEPETTPIPETVAEPAVAVQAEPTTETEVELETELEPKPAADFETPTTSETETEPVAVAVAVADSEIPPIAETEAAPEVAVQIDPAVETEAEPEIELETEPETELIVEAEVVELNNNTDKLNSTSEHEDAKTIYVTIGNK